MLHIYRGEFLTSPWPMELSLGMCDRRCVYCFSNHARRKVQFSITQPLVAARKAQKSKSYLSELIRRKYPILIANHGDPLSEKRLPAICSLLEFFNEYELPVTFQTKGGNVDEILKRSKPTVWYITLTTLDEEISKKMEPGSPVPSERLQNMKDLIQAGHRVIWGFNPCIEVMCGNAEELVAAVFECGVRNVWIEELHLSNDQIGNMTGAEKEALGAKVLTQARARNRDHSFFYRIRTLLRAKGFEMFSNGQPTRSNFWDVEEIMPVRFPVFQDFLNWVYDTKKPGETLTGTEYVNWWEKEMRTIPFSSGAIRDYIASRSRKAIKGMAWKKITSWKMFFETVWKDPDSPFSPVNNWSFRYAENEAGDVPFYEDGPDLIFSPVS